MSTTIRKRGRGSSRPREGIVDQRVVKAIGHPLRFRLLLAYNQKTASPNQLANELEEPLGNVAYHTRILLDLGAVELVDTAQRRGAIEHYYRATMLPFFDDEEWSRLPLTTRRSIIGQDLQALFAHASHAISGGGFDRPDVHVSFTKLDVDRRGYEDVVQLLGDTLERLLEIRAEVAGRRVGDEANADEEIVSTEVGLLHFERVSPPAPESRQAKGRRKTRASGSRRA